MGAVAWHVLPELIMPVLELGEEGAPCCHELSPLVCEGLPALVVLLPWPRPDFCLLMDGDVQKVRSLWGPKNAAPASSSANYWLSCHAYNKLVQTWHHSLT